MSDSRSDDGYPDLSQILAGPINSPLCDPRSFDALQDVNDEGRPQALLARSGLDLMPEPCELEFDNTISHNEQSSSQSAAQNLLQREFTDQDALLKIFPSADITNNCIGASHYIAVLRMLLFQWKIADCDDNHWLSSGVLGNPRSYARILRRLGAELKFVCSKDGCDSRYQSASRRLYTCLGDLEEDILKAYTVEGPRDGEVQIFTETEPYKDCLRSIVQVLDNCKEGRQANAKFLARQEEISQTGIEPPKGVHFAGIGADLKA